MNVTIWLVALVVFAFVFGQLLHRLVSRHVSLSGAEYLLVGALIGPNIPPRLLTADSLGQLIPVMNLLLGLVGFLVGLRVRHAFAGWRGPTVGLLSSIVTCSIVALGSTSLAAMLLPASHPLVLNQVLLSGDGWVIELYASREHLVLGAALGVAATVSSSGLLLGIGESLKLRGYCFGLLRSTAAVSQLFAIIAMGAVLALTREPPTFPIAGFGRWFWLVAAVALGLVCGICFTLFIGKEESQSRIFLATIGTVTFAAGTGAALEVSPLLVNLISGLTVASLSTHATVLLKELDRLQHPMFVLLLILTGAYWTPVSGAAWLLPLAYLVMRFVAVNSSMWLFSNLFGRRFVANRMGTALMAQGTLAVAVIIDFAFGAPEFGAAALSTVLVGTLVFDMASARSVRRVLVDAEAETLSLTNTHGHQSTASSEAGL